MCAGVKGDAGYGQVGRLVRLSEEGTKGFIFRRARSGRPMIITFAGGWKTGVHLGRLILVSSDWAGVVVEGARLIAVDEWHERGLTDADIHHLETAVGLILGLGGSP